MICLSLMAICQEQAVATQCFSNSLFVTGFLSRIVDPSLHAPILSLIRHFLTHFDAPLGIVAECICDIVDGCMDNTRVVSELLQCVNDSMTHNNRMAMTFESIVVSATNFVIAHSSKELLGHVLHLSTQVSGDRLLALGEAIKVAEGTSPSEATVSGLLGILARSRSASLSRMFFVREPLIFVVLLSIAQTPEASRQYVTLISELCLYSAYNCLQCHKGEIDLLLLEVVRHFPNAFGYRNCEIHLRLTESDVTNLILPIVALTASFACSPQVVTRMLSVTSPGSDRIFPKFATEVMSSMSRTMTVLCQEPTTVLQLGYPDREIVYSVPGPM
jgi:hypothetical protein